MTGSMWIAGRRSLALGLGLATCAAGTPAAGQTDDPRFCPNRPSLGSSACTTEPGQIQVELAGLDWERDRTQTERRDTIVAGDAIARFGVGPATEIQVAWTAFGSERRRDRDVGGIDHSSGVGDVTLAVRQNLRAPDGKGLSFGLQPFVTLPVGSSPIGAGDWAAGVLLPVTFDVGDATNLQLTGEAEAAVDEDGSGRHLRYSGILGLSQELGERFTINGEVMLERDDDPAGRETRALAAVSVAWHPAKTWQIDLLGVAGLNRDAPDVRLALGGALLLR